MLDLNKSVQLVLDTMNRDDRGSDNHRIDLRECLIGFAEAIRCKTLEDVRLMLHNHPVNDDTFKALLKATTFNDVEAKSYGSIRG